MIRKYARKIAKYSVSFITEMLHCAKWLISSNRRKNDCLNKMPRDEKIVVSLTSFPDRIKSVSKTIETILNQKECKPDKIELWLAESQFQNREKCLPVYLLQLKKYGLDIMWCEDLKSYKKLLPALRIHPNDIIVTADDDVYYSRKWLGKLYRSYKINPIAIQCHRATKIIQNNGKIDVVPGGKEYYKSPSCLNKLVGVGGVLYPANSLNIEVFDLKSIMKYAPTNDDVWFWFMAILNHYNVNVVSGNEPNPITVWAALKSSKLSDINDHGENLFWKQFENMMGQYEYVRNVIIEELRVHDKSHQNILN